MKNFGEELDLFIQERSREILDKKEIPELPIAFTDNISEIIEKLIIVHIRMWFLEDACAANYLDDVKLAELKRKIDVCFKQKRPALVQGLNKILDEAVRNGKNLAEQEVKLYKGHS